MRRLLLLFMMMGLCLTAYGAAPDPQKPVAQVELSQLFPEVHEYIWGTVAFASDTSLAVGMCPTYTRPCKLSVLEWKHGDLWPVASTRDFGPTLLNLHRAPNNGVLAVAVTGSALLYSDDLSSERKIEPVQRISPSGGIVIRRPKSGWQLWRFDSEERLICSSQDELLAISDDFFVIRGKGALRVESIEGGTVGSLPEPGCLARVHILGGQRLYLEDCKRTEVVDFRGNTKSRLQRMKGWSAPRIGFEVASADGNRFLSMNYSRKISFLQNAGEIAVAIATFGMGVSDEVDNREEIRVADTRTGAICLDRWRSFPAGSGIVFHNVVAISPSGEFVASVEDGTLAVYRLPGVCALRP